MRRKLLGTAMVIGSMLTAVLAAPAPASAADICWAGSNTWWCRNRSGAGVYSLSWDGTTYLVGYMNSTTSWFDCRTENPAWVGGPHPHRWLWTQADNGQYGWMKDSDISSETDPVTVCQPT